MFDSESLVDRLITAATSHQIFYGSQGNYYCVCGGGPGTDNAEHGMYFEWPSHANEHVETACRQAVVTVLDTVLKDNEGDI